MWFTKCATGTYWILPSRLLSRKRVPKPAIIEMMIGVKNDWLMVANIKPITAEEFARRIAETENADRLFELINGEIVEKAPT